MIAQSTIWLFALIQGSLVPLIPEYNMQLCIMDKAYYEREYQVKMTCSTIHDGEINERYSTTPNK